MIAIPSSQRIVSECDEFESAHIKFYTGKTQFATVKSTLTTANEKQNEMFSQNKILFKDVITKRVNVQVPYNWKFTTTNSACVPRSHEQQQGILAPAKTYWTFLELFQNISDFFGPEHPELSLKCSITYQVHY